MITMDDDFDKDDDILKVDDSGEVEAVELMVYDVVVTYLDNTSEVYTATDVEFHGDSVVLLLPAQLEKETHVVAPGSEETYPKLVNYPSMIVPENAIRHIETEPVDTVTLHPDDVDGDFIDI